MCFGKLVGALGLVVRFGSSRSRAVEVVSSWHQPKRRQAAALHIFESYV